MGEVFFTQVSRPSLIADFSQEISLLLFVPFLNLTLLIPAPPSQYGGHSRDGRRSSQVCSSPVGESGQVTGVLGAALSLSVRCSDSTDCICLSTLVRIIANYQSSAWNRVRILCVFSEIKMSACEPFQGQLCACHYAGAREHWTMCPHSACSLCLK